MQDFARYKYKYITDEMLTRLDTAGDTQFSRIYVLMHEFGLTPIQAGRTIKYWTALREVEKLRITNRS